MTGKSTRGTKSTASGMDPADLRATADALDKEADGPTCPRRTASDQLDHEKTTRPEPQGKQPP